MINKKAQSQIISTVILILIVLISAGIIIGVVIPMIQRNLKETSCLDYIGKITIVNDPELTCYNSSSQEVYVKVRVGDVLDEIEGFSVVLENSNSKSYDITPINPSGDVIMYGGGVFGLPDKNTFRTYILQNFGEKPDAIRVHPILKGGKTCEESDSMVGIGICRPD